MQIIRRFLTETRPYLASVTVALLMALVVLRVYAQEATPVVTDDQVNQIASQMYCPVCEDIPLDVCGTDACIQWRAEIKTQLQAGRTPTQIIADFVSRYGDRVVGTPQDPTLRALSLVTPWIIAAVIVVIALWVLNRWWRSKRLLATAGLTAPPVEITDEDYRARLERDLQSRR